MKLTKVGAGATVALTLMATAAFAGLRQPAPVAVDLDAQFASGDLITAADAKNDEVFIGCGTRNFDDGVGGVFRFAFCQAADAEGDRVVCNTSNPELVQTIREINDSGYIQFSWTDDGAGNLTCSATGFSTQSFYADKHSKGNQKGNER
ncbi:hypothetical protein PUV54_16025 [Hyphococcus flavus]|uniref:Uncharacterized protein n=1 Tax=Hyphococcus flavus TaxID=1866326 RepID=A0AAE9ZBC8_9PROT|nr:hypothetical protein [Hyphococcus flavus]WDI31459.1 hypothetical protein PUV54_16025 [Hyphococcus flavus]